ncbi:MAG TPA: type II toxin-antitoxin system VapC family toxin [Chloroflexota bacterium]|nr:type II toxin-antitoxin system VapC family toxin [Chloroflexota bacterium]
MTRCYIDTNFLYLHLRQRDDPAVAAWRIRLETELAGEAGVVSALVLDELAYRSVLGWLRDTGDNNPVSTFRTSTSAVMRKMRTRLGRLWAAIDELDFELATTDRTVISQAVSFMSNPGLAPRDAFHAAHALDSGCSVMVSSDPDYDRLTALRRLGPG